MNSLNFYINTFKRKIFNNIYQSSGWKTQRNIIVIESDDWGSIRMPDRETYERILKAGIRVDNSHYNKFDTLASSDDFNNLFEILTKYKDKNGKNPVITANTIVANPDFKKIRESNFGHYYYEPFTETIKKYKNRTFDDWTEGIKMKLFYPQLHGREHLNVERWMRYLQKPSNEVRFAFDNCVIGIGPKISMENNPSFVQAFDSNIYLKDHTPEVILMDAAKIFMDVFGYESKSFISPNYIWDKIIEDIVCKFGVEYIQGIITQQTLKGFVFNYLGKVNSNGQFYLIRNVNFEPSSDYKKDWVNQSLKEIENSFRLNKPAVISIHRVNFIGSIFEENRIRSLKLLDNLLKEITKRWENIEFMNSVELGELIKNDFHK
jgi:hypothetical protein